MFNKMLARFGVGSAVVDTQLEKSSFFQGEKITGNVLVKGGKAEQQIDQIYLYLVIQPMLEGQPGEIILDEFLMSDTFAIGAKERKLIPFEIDLPNDTPVSTGGAAIYLKTGLDVKMAVDPDDLDAIEVQPHPTIRKIIKAFEQLDYRMTEVFFDDTEYQDELPFLQKYRFMYRSNGSLAVVFTNKGSEIIVGIQNQQGRSLRFSLFEQEYENNELLTERIQAELHKGLR